MSPRPTPPQRGDEAQLYRDLDHRVRSMVRANVRAPDDLIEDAISFAWLQLLRHQPRRDTLLPWLTRVAIREAWRLARRERRDASLDDMASDLQARHDPHTTELAIDARQALEVIAALPERQRTYLALFLNGNSYDQIAATTGTSHTAVNKHLARARKTLRHHRAH